MAGRLEVGQRLTAETDAIADGDGLETPRSATSGAAGGALPGS